MNSVSKDSVIHVNHQKPRPLPSLSGSESRLNHLYLWFMIIVFWSQHHQSVGVYELIIWMWCSRYGIRPENVIIYGQSIGTVPSVDLASRYESAAVVLHSPLTSGMRVAFPDTKKTYCFDAFPKWVSLFFFFLLACFSIFLMFTTVTFSPNLRSTSYQLDTYCLFTCVLLWAAMLWRRRLVGWLVHVFCPLAIVDVCPLVTNIFQQVVQCLLYTCSP